MRDLCTALWLAALAVVLASAGCSGNLYLGDDEGAPRPHGSLLEAHPDELSLPYVLGTEVRVSVRGGGAGATSTWSVTSDDPAVFRVDGLETEDDDHHLVARCTAVAEGAAVVRLLDESGYERRRATVTVRAPDGARFFAQGPLRIVEEAAPEAREARVVSGGTGVFAVAYYRGTQRLYGRGIVATDAEPPFVVENHPSGGRPINEWLFVMPTAPGAQTVHLTAAGRTLLEVPLVAVPESDVARLALEEQAGAKGNDEDEVWVLAQARDAAGAEIHGVYSTWTLAGVPQLDSDGDPEPARGDLYRYKWRPGGAARSLVATHGSLTATLSIAAHDGYVSDTTYLGCAAAPGARRGAIAMAVLALLLAGLWLRRGLGARPVRRGRRDRAPRRVVDRD